MAPTAVVRPARSTDRAVTVVGAGLSASAIAGRARDAEIIEAAGGGLLPAPAAGRESAAEAILRMLDRLSLAPPAD